VWGSVREADGYKDLMDYYMSEKFGLDWKEYDHQRMATFKEIMTLQGEKEKRESDEARSKNKSHGR